MTDKSAFVTDPAYRGSATTPQPINPLQFADVIRLLFNRPSALERPDSYSRAPTRPIHSASLRGDE